jgi:hypothetical protein
MFRSRTLLSIAFSAVVVVSAPAQADGLGSGLRIHLAGFTGAPIQRVAHSQKAGPSQKIALFQTGSVIQKGGAIQHGGCSAGPRCGYGSSSKGGGGCGSCNPCCIIPALLTGVGNLIDGIFRCDRCGSSSCSKGRGCGPRVRTQSCGCPLLFSRRCGSCAGSCFGGKGGSGGKFCSSCGGGGYGPKEPVGPGNPFIDDGLTPSPVPMREARVIRKARVVQPPAVVSAESKRPRKLSISHAEPIGKIARVSLNSTEQIVVRANNQTDDEDTISIPRNPLRD